MTTKKIKIKRASVLEILTRSRRSGWTFESPYFDKNGDESVIWIHDNDYVADWDCVFPSNNSFHQGLLESNLNRYIQLPSVTRKSCQILKLNGASKKQ